MKYAVTLDYTATISVEADSPEEAEAQAEGTDATDVLDDLGTGIVIHVEEE